MNVFISFGRWLGLIPPVPLLPDPIPAPASPAAPPPEPPTPPASKPLPVPRAPDRIFDPQTVAAKRLDVDRAVAQCNFVARSYGVDIWAQVNRVNFAADLLVIHLHDNLRELVFSLHDANGAVVFLFRIAFGTDKLCSPVVDAAGGVELPVLTPGAVASHLVRVIRNGVDPEVYQHLLKIRWEKGKKLPNRPADEFEANHTVQKSNGRQRAYISAAGARRQLTVNNVVGSGDYAFGYDAQLDTKVFLHLKSAPSGFRFYPGQVVTAVIVQTRRGAQGRNIAAV